MLRLFGEKLRHTRTRQGLSQSELARQLGLARHTHISHLEAGRRAPSLDFLLSVATILGVTTDYFLFDEIPLDPILYAFSQIALTSLPHLLGAKIRQLRVQRGLTQTELMTQLGLTSQGYISKLEAGTKEPSPDLIVAMARLFSVTTEYLLRDDMLVEQVN